MDRLEVIFVSTSKKDTLFGMRYNLVIIFMIMFWDDFVDIGKRCQTTINFCICYYFSYDIIFIVFSWLFVGVCNFICGSVDYVTRGIWSYYEIVYTCLLVVCWT